MAILGRRSLIWIATLALWGPPSAAFAATLPEGGVTQEYDLKAAFLFNFTRFVEWPDAAFANAAAPITIGIVGGDPFGESLDEIVADETVDNRKLVVRRFRSIEQVEDCQILFIHPSLVSHMEQLRARLGGRSVLTVGENKEFTARGGMIAFETVKNRVRLRVNLEAARAAKLTISSMLLRQAKIVGSEKM